MPTLSIRDVTVAYTDVGQGPPVLLVHGSAASRRFWRTLVERLAPRYRVVAPDLIGYGESSPWHAGTRATDLDVVSAFANAIGEPLHLVGHSYGGALALRVARELGSKLASLALIEPASFDLLDPRGDAAALAEIEAVAGRHLELVAEGELEACAAHFMGYWIGGDAWAAMPAETSARIVQAMPKIAAEFRVLFRHPETLGAYRRLRAPTLLVRGTRTTLTAHEVVERLAATLPQCDFVEIQGAGHMAPLSHPDAVNAAIETHFAQSEAETLFGAAA
jgi:pimeloyl-ACP methyl ester carboxylesterase